MRSYRVSARMMDVLHKLAQFMTIAFIVFWSYFLLHQAWFMVGYASLFIVFFQGASRFFEGCIDRFYLAQIRGDEW